MVPSGRSRMELGDRGVLFGRTDHINDAQDLLSRGNEQVRGPYADQTLGAL